MSITPTVDAGIVSMQQPVLEFEWQRRELQAALAGRNRKPPDLHKLPYFSRESVLTGSILGIGTFSSVYQVIMMPSLEEATQHKRCGNTSIAEEDSSSVTDTSSSESLIEDDPPAIGARRVTEESSLTNTTDQSNGRRILSKSISAISPGKTYALKRLHELSGSKNDLKDRRAAEKDLVLEAGILAHMPSHENVIELFALSDEFWEEPGSGFLILDQLTETLHDRLQRWRRAAISGPHPPKIPFYKPTARHQRRQQEQNSRMQHAALGVARAMEFLHCHKVIYRDLKPHNVGFDAAGTVKLFDFGLARVHAEGARLLTGFTGSARYMAPEVARSESYSFPADVHAYAILLWEICTLEKAYCKTVTLQHLVQQVVHRHIRPSLQKVASPIIRELLPVSWHRDSAMRPSFALVAKQIELEGQAVREQQEYECAEQNKSKQINIFSL
jgi:serine/threonine protein kinase